MKKICSGDGQFTPYRPWSDERKAASKVGAMVRKAKRSKSPDPSRAFYLMERHLMKLHTKFVEDHKPISFDEFKTRNENYRAGCLQFIHDIATHEKFSDFDLAEKLWFIWAGKDKYLRPIVISRSDTCH